MQRGQCKGVKSALDSCERRTWGQTFLSSFQIFSSPHCLSRLRQTSKLSPFRISLTWDTTLGQFPLAHKPTVNPDLPVKERVGIISMRHLKKHFVRFGAITRVLVFAVIIRYQRA